MNASKASRKKEETIWSDLRRDVRRHGRMWEAGRARRPELVPFEDAGALVAVLERRGESDAARRAVLCALVREHRRTAHPLWQGLLLVAFEPMVRSLRASLARREGRDATQAAVGVVLAPGEHGL